MISLLMLSALLAGHQPRVEPSIPRGVGLLAAAGLTPASLAVAGATPDEASQLFERARAHIRVPERRAGQRPAVALGSASHVQAAAQRLAFRAELEQQLATVLSGVRPALASMLQRMRTNQRSGATEFLAAGTVRASVQRRLELAVVAEQRALRRRAAVPPAAAAVLSQVRQMPEVQEARGRLDANLQRIQARARTEGR